MLQILGIVFPIFAIIGLGKAAIRWKFMDATGSAILSRFTFYVPIPALLFGTISEMAVGNSFRLGGAYIVCCLMLYGIALAAGRWLTEPSLAHRAVFALDATLSNAVFLGTPLVSALWGVAGLNLLIGIIIFTNILIPLSIILMEIGSNTKTSRLIVSDILLALLKNPVIVFTILGLLWRLTGLPLPAPARLFVDLLARAAAPLALFCLGMSLPAIRWDVIQEAAMGSALKLIVMPALVWGFCYAVGVSGLALAVAVLTAAMPTGANAFLVARGTTAYGASSATTVVLATLLSLITLPVGLFLLR
jgi:malonate transporter and related proteins